MVEQNQDRVALHMDRRQNSGEQDMCQSRMLKDTACEIEIDIEGAEGADREHSWPVLAAMVEGLSACDPAWQLKH